MSMNSMSMNSMSMNSMSMNSMSMNSMNINIPKIIDDELYAFIVLWVVIVSAGSILYTLDYCITRCRGTNI